MKRFLHCSTNLFIALVALSSLFPHQASLAQSYTYSPNNTVIDNPERGLRDQAGARLRHLKIKLVPKYSGFTLTELKAGKWENGQITESPLADYLKQEFAAAALKGEKLIPRPHFIWDKEPGDEPDNEANMLLALRKYIDAIRPHLSYIAYFEAGFLGDFGEWHYAVSGKPKHQNFDSLKFKIVTELANNFPSRTVAIRYPLIKLEALFNYGQGGFGSFDRKIGYHNDCFHGEKYKPSYSDVGTFSNGTLTGPTIDIKTPEYNPSVWPLPAGWTPPFLLRDYQKYDAKGAFKSWEPVRQWLINSKGAAPTSFNHFGVPLGGEMCSQISLSDKSLYDKIKDGTTELSSYSALFDPVKFVDSLKYSGWDDIALEEPFQIAPNFDWVRSTLRNELGYRFELGSARVAVSNGNVEGSIKVKNTGWGKLYNRKRLLLVLYNTQGQGKFGGRADVTGNIDLRSLKSGQPEVEFKFSTPSANFTQGTYDTYLQIVDSDPTNEAKFDMNLLRKPNYNIRMAYKLGQDDNTWVTNLSDTTAPLGGLNKLGIVVTVP